MMLSLLKSLSAEPLPTVQAQPDRCLRRRLSTCTCSLCLDSCPAGALSFHQGQVRLDRGKCTDCLSCVAVCPNEALATNWTLEEMLRSVRKLSAKQPVVACSRQSRRSADEITVPCLAIFGWEDMVALGRSGCPSIAFDISACRNCENFQAAERFLNIFRRVTERAAPILTTELALIDNKGTAPVREAPDRRAFLAEFRARISFISQLSPSMAQPPHAQKAGRCLPQRVRIIERIITDAQEEERENLHALCTHKLIVDPVACTRCPLCTGMCPTGALRIAGTGTEKQLLFSGTRCSGCGLCLSFCRRNALSLSPSPLAVETSGSPLLVAH